MPHGAANPQAKRHDAPAAAKREGRQSEMLTVEDVAQMAGLAVGTIRYWRSIGTGPKSFRLGRRVVYKRADVQRWIDEAAGES